MATTKPVKIRSFLPPKTGGGTSNPIAAMTTAVTRMGFVVEDIGNILASQMALSQQLLTGGVTAQQQQLKKDKALEDRIEKGRVKDKDLDKGAKAPPTGMKLTWLEKLLGPFMWLVKSVATWFVLDFLSDPKNKGIIKTGIKIITAWVSTLWSVVQTSVNLLLGAFGEESLLMGALKIVGGLAALVVADRILKPWKLIGDAFRLTRFLGNAMRKNSSPKQLHKQAVRARAGRIAHIRRMKGLKAGAGKFLKGGGKFLKGGGISVIAGVASTATRLAEGEKVETAVGAGVGAVVGGLAMSALLTPILGPLGPIVGQFLGSFLGEKIGAFIGDSITPILEPLKNFFLEIALPAFQAYISPVVDAFVNLWDEMVPVFVMIGDFLKPIADSAVQGMIDMLNSPWVKAALETLQGWINGGMELMQGAADNLGAFANVLGLENEMATAEREKRQAEKAVTGTDNEIAAAEQKLQFLQRHQEKHGRDARIFTGEHADLGVNTVENRIRAEQQHIRELQEKRKRQQQQVMTSTQVLEELKVRGPSKGGKGSTIFPLPKGRFAGQANQYHRTHPNSSRGAHAGIDLTEKPPFGADPAIDVVALTGGVVLAEKFLGTLDYLSGMMIKGDDGYDQRYVHMMPSVRPGDRVEAGQKIGKLVDMRRVGRDVANTHLHLEVYKRGKGGDLSPHNVYPHLFKTPNSHQNRVVNTPPDPVATINTDSNKTSPPPPTPTRRPAAAQPVVVQPIVRPASSSGSGANVQYSTTGAGIR